MRKLIIVILDIEISDDGMEIKNASFALYEFYPYHFLQGGCSRQPLGLNTWLGLFGFDANYFEVYFFFVIFLHFLSDFSPLHIVDTKIR